MKPAILSIALLLLLAMGCSQPQQPAALKQPPAATGHKFVQNGSVREIDITPETMEFPEHEGKKEFVSYCAICHSLKYITMQPDFPRATWEAEVTKMIAKYKAPVDSITGKKIVDYLMAIKGVKETAAK